MRLHRRPPPLMRTEVRPDPGTWAAVGLIGGGRSIKIGESENAESQPGKAGSQLRDSDGGQLPAVLDAPPNPNPRKTSVPGIIADASPRVNPAGPMKDCADRHDPTPKESLKTQRVGYEFDVPPRCVLDDIRPQKLSRIDSDVLGVMLRFRRTHKASVWITKGVIAEALGVDERTVRRSLARLKQFGWISHHRVPKPDPDDPKNRTGWRFVFLWIVGSIDGLDPAALPAWAKGLTTNPHPERGDNPVQAIGQDCPGDRPRLSEKGGQSGPPKKTEEPSGNKEKTNQPKQEGPVGCSFSSGEIQDKNNPEDPEIAPLIAKALKILDGVEATRKLILDLLAEEYPPHWITYALDALAKAMRKDKKVEYADRYLLGILKRLRTEGGPPPQLKVQSTSTPPLVSFPERSSWPPKIKAAAIFVHEKCEEIGIPTDGEIKIDGERYRVQPGRVLTRIVQPFFRAKPTPVDEVIIAGARYLVCFDADHKCEIAQGPLEDISLAASPYARPKASPDAPETVAANVPSIAACEQRSMGPVAPPEPTEDERTAPQREFLAMLDQDQLSNFHAKPDQERAEMMAWFRVYLDRVMLKTAIAKLTPRGHRVVTSDVGRSVHTGMPVERMV